jgi:hypothetical protein
MPMDQERWTTRCNSHFIQHDQMMNIEIHIHQPPAALKKCEAIQYCGGSPDFFEELEKQFPELMRPLRKGNRRAGILYLRTNIDAALTRLQSSR